MSFELWAYVAVSLLHWDTAFFLYEATPNFWLKSYLFWLRSNNPEAVNEHGGETYYPDTIPLYG